MIQKKKDTIKSLAIHEKDVGSTEIQIGLLTDKISKLAQHFKIDYSIFEITANKNKYLILKNKPLHSVDSYTNQIKEV